MIVATSNAETMAVAAFFVAVAAFILAGLAFLVLLHLLLKREFYRGPEGHPGPPGPMGQTGLPGRPPGGYRPPPDDETTEIERE